MLTSPNRLKVGGRYKEVPYSIEENQVPLSERNSIAYLVMALVFGQWYHFVSGGMLINIKQPICKKKKKKFDR